MAKDEEEDQLALIDVSHPAAKGLRRIAHLSFDEFILDGEMNRHLGCSLLQEQHESFCTMRAMTDVVKIPGPRGYKWPRLAEAHKFFFQTDLEDAHDAMADVRACAKIYFELVRRNSPTVSTEAAV